MRTLAIASALILIAGVAVQAWTHGKVYTAGNFLTDIPGNHLTDLSGNRLTTP